MIALFLAVADGLRYVANAVLDRPERAIFVFGVLVLLVGLAFRWPYDKLQRVLDRRIFKDAYDYGASLEGLSRDLSLVGGLDMLGSVLPSKLQQLMNLDIAVLLVSDAGDIRECGTAGEYQSATCLALAAAVRDVRAAPQLVPVANDGPFLVVPLQTRNELVGYLCLGPKLSREPFRPEDYALLTTLSGHLAAIVRNAQLVDELRAQIDLLQAQKATLNTLNERLQCAHEEERARIGADLHDEVLQTSLHLRRRLLTDGQGRADTAGHVAVIETVIDQLRLVCTTVRPAALDELGLAAALEVLALDLGADGTAPIVLDVDPAVTDVALPAALELVVYRAAQEALNNVIRHAHPTMIQLSLLHSDGTVCLSVCDDGAGFVVPVRLDKLAAAGHLGLVGLEQRVGHVGGRLSVTSAPGRGTVVRVDIPVPVAKEATG